MTHASPAGPDGAPHQAWAVTAEKVNDVVHRLAAATSPVRLIAFGSAVRGELAAANDLDLLVVEPELTSRYSEVVTSQARFDERAQIPGTLEDAAHREGRVLHDSL